MVSNVNEVLQMKYQSPHATSPLFIPVLVVCNTPDEDIQRNITANSAKDLTWLKGHEENDGIAVMVGGGPSINEHIDDIRNLVDNGGTVFAMNAASQWCRENGINVDYQCIIDAKEETADLVDTQAKAHLFGSQVSSKTMDLAPAPIVWHLGTDNIEDHFPEERKKRGGYALLGGGTAVGNSALCAAYALGYRKLHVFGYDSSNKEDITHAYSQPMNQFVPNVAVEWAGKKFNSSVCMKAQAEKFQLTSHALKEHGCQFKVYGDGLLQTMYNTDYHDLTEQEKYQLMWQLDGYRAWSPGENVADMYLDKFKPEGLVIDFGCGTGRAGIKFVENGMNTMLVDFTDNCRDKEARTIPFLQWNLADRIPLSAPNGFCTDVMEHIPTDDVKGVIDNIMASADKVFFQISTVDDKFGKVIDEPLHLTVKSHSWWKHLFVSNYNVEWESDQQTASLFYITNKGD